MFHENVSLTISGFLEREMFSTYCFQECFQIPLASNSYILVFVDLELALGLSGWLAVGALRLD
jgi:hypothetical protein